MSRHYETVVSTELNWPLLIGLSLSAIFVVALALAVLLAPRHRHMERVAPFLMPAAFAPIMLGLGVNQNCLSNGIHIIPRHAIAAAVQHETSAGHDADDAEYDCSIRVISWGKEHSRIEVRCASLSNAIPT